MSNMSYCRFRNTLDDLRDCQESLEDKVGSIEEHKARIRLIKICKEIAGEYPDDNGEDLDHEEG